MTTTAAAETLIATEDLKAGDVLVESWGKITVESVTVRRGLVAVRFVEGGSKAYPLSHSPYAIVLR